MTSAATFQIESNPSIGPSRQVVSIVPSDTDALPMQIRGIYVGAGGDVVLRPLASDEDVTYRNLPDASYIYVCASYVRSSGTTAGYLLAEV